jgi:hypothetical protein
VNEQERRRWLRLARLAAWAISLLFIAMVLAVMYGAWKAGQQPYD